MNELKYFVKNIPVVGELAVRAYKAAGLPTALPYTGSASYWELRYALGGNSGPGSYTRLAEFKAEVLNAFVAEHKVQSVIEFGCGDGNQLKLAAYPKYLGLDVSKTIVAKCRKTFARDESKTFALVVEYQGEKRDLALSLDVILHLVEEKIFEEYMRVLFESSNRYVIIYSSNREEEGPLDAPHVRHRRFSAWVGSNVIGWNLIQHIPNKFPFREEDRTGCFADFFIYERAREH